MGSVAQHAVRGSAAFRATAPIRLCVVCLLACSALLAAAGCAGPAASQERAGEPPRAGTVVAASCAEGASAATAEAQRIAAEAAARSQLDIVQDLRPGLSHGEKGTAYQKYIVLHDTEGDAPAASVIDWWDGNGTYVGAHFVVNKDGTIVQCVPMDEIAHHAGFGDTGHNQLYGVEDESRDDKRGTSPIGSWAADYGMNAHSVGIEMVHVGGSGAYPEAQLEALDALIAYIDSYYGFESEIVDHKAWRTGNSDTSPEFSTYLENYKTTRTHDGSSV